MSQDRLAAYRQQQSHEMLDMQSGGYASQLSQYDGTTDPMSQFYNQVTAIQDDIATFGSNVSRIAELHSRTLSAADEGASRQNAALLDDVVAQTRQLSNELKDKIQALGSYPMSGPQNQTVRRNQTALLRKKFVEVLQNYQNVEQDYRQKYRQRVERQFRIVKPDATPEEVAAVVNDTDGAGSKIFTQALSSSTRYGEGRTVYREVQDRHHDIQRIDRTLEELAQLFNDLSVLVAEQDEALERIRSRASSVERDVRAGDKETGIAVVHARSARRKRWICFGIIVLVLAVVAIVLGVVIGGKS